MDEKRNVLLDHRGSGLAVGTDGRIVSIRMPGRDATVGNKGIGNHIRMSWEDGETLSSGRLQWKTVSPEDAPVPGGVQLTGRSEAVRLDVRIEPDEFGPMLVWKVSVTNLRTSRLGCVEINLLSPEALPEDWLCTLPFGGGWAIALRDFEPGSTVNLRYPVQGSLQWIDVGGPKCGISFMTRDPVPWLKDFNITRTPGGLQISVAHRHLQLEANQTLELPGVAAGAHFGDWQAGAVTYSRWLDSVVPDPALAPDWLPETGGWAWVSGKGQYAERIDNSYRDIPQRSRDFSEAGMDCIQLAAWFEHGHDTRYPDYVAAPSLGGEDQLRAAAETIQQEGRKLALYTNGRLFDPLSETAREHPEWKSWAVHAPEGQTIQVSIAEEFIGVTTQVPEQEWDPSDEIAKEIYGKVVFATMCPSAEGWQDEYSDRLGYAARRYHVDGLYMDQILGAVAVPCFATQHTHERPYLAWRGYHDLLEKVRRKVKSARPEAYLATEGFSDILAQHMDIVQSHNDWPGPCPNGSFQLPEMTRLAVPWLLQANGPIYPDKYEMVRLVHAAASGVDIACFGKPPRDEFGRHVRWLMETRRRFGRQMYRSSPVPTQIEGFPSRRALALEGENLIICCSALDGQAEGNFSIRVSTDFSRIRGPVRWESLDGSGEADLAQEGEAVRIILPAAEMAILWAERDHQ